jgi:signal transduction histidine kinase
MMSMVAQLFDNNLITIYFFYGLAFFSMGLALLIESGRSSDFPFAAAMAPLAAFGIIHGFHEWLEMFQLLNLAGTTSIPDWLLNDGIRLFLLAISFSLLLIFGVRLIFANHNPGTDGRWQSFAAAAVLLGVWLVSVLVAQQIYNLEGDELSASADVLGRYILAIPGALLAAWAILLEQRTFSRRGMQKFGRALLGAALALIIYGIIGQLFAKTSPIFPSNTINGSLFNSVFGVPIQLLRALCAVWMTLSIIRALRAFDIETQQKLVEAQDAREKARKAMLEDKQNIEHLNQELREAVRNLSSLYGFSQNLAKTLDKREMVEDALIQFVASEPHIDASMVFLCDRDLQSPYVAAKTQCPVHNEIRDTMFKQATLVGEYVAASGQPAIWNGTQVKPISSPFQYEINNKDDPLVVSTAGRTLGVPLNIPELCTGSLVMCTVPGNPPFSAREYSLISTAAEELSIALQNAALYREIQERDKLRGELLHQVVNAQETERQRIARELHDGPGQTLTALGLGLAAVSGRINNIDSKTSEQVNELKTLSTSAMLELRDVISNLRPAVLDDLGLIPALRGQVQALTDRSGIDAQLIATGSTRRLSPGLETIIFRVVQEALTNVNKHSGATSVNVELNFQDENLFIGVCDNGRGFDLNSIYLSSGDVQAWGLLGIQERVELANGTFEITTKPDVGTTLEINLPLGGEEAIRENGED